MNTILLPMVIQVGLTFTLLVILSIRRTLAIQKDRSLLKRAALDVSQYPEDIVKLSNNFANQCQLPPLFYVVSVLALISGATGPLAGALAWGYVATRIGHTIIHTTNNFVPMRALVFFIGVGCLIGLWVVVITQIVQDPQLVEWIQ